MTRLKIELIPLTNTTLFSTTIRSLGFIYYPQQGGFLPLFFAGIEAASALTGGVSAVASTIIEGKHKRAAEKEQERHNKEMEKIINNVKTLQIGFGLKKNKSIPVRVPAAHRTTRGAMLAEALWSGSHNYFAGLWAVPGARAVVTLKVAVVFLPCRLGIRIQRAFHNLKWEVLIRDMVSLGASDVTRSIIQIYLTDRKAVLSVKGVTAFAVLIRGCPQGVALQIRDRGQTIGRQRKALLSLTGAYRTTSTDALQVVSGQMPLDIKIEWNALVKSFKSKYLSVEQLHESRERLPGLMAGEVG
ncbi:Hypothetical protein CINCED_3A020977 [Cinara cedri]|uniref:Uncharacterized protein n=1 Tax=Cinara cedri TaxID=506608 RepID=A0A5E4MBL1_9HEMI|nr:Hypothetical protein CINCED_3A020977 [Cinara cedri]